MSSNGIISGVGYNARDVFTHTKDTVINLVWEAAKGGEHPLLPDNRELPKDVPQLDPATEQAWKDVCTLAEESNEKSMYHPIANFLTLLTKFEHLFMPTVTINDDGETVRKDIIAVKPTREEIRECNDEHNLTLPTILNRPRIYYADIQCIIDVKPYESTTGRTAVHIIQLLKHLFLASRYQPRHAVRRGIIAYRDGFITVDDYPDAAFYSELYPWSSNVALAVLYDTFKARQLFTSDEFTLVDPPEKVDEDGPLSRFKFCITPPSGHVEEYQLHDIYNGYGWNRNTYVGFAIPTWMEINNFEPSGSCGVVKHGWRDTRWGSNELNVAKAIINDANDATKEKCTAGLVRVDLERSRAGVFQRVDVNGTVIERERVTLFLKTIGETVAHCKSVLEFLMVMYDLVEVHRMLVEDHGILHRDVSWKNILINVIHLDDKGPDDLCDRPFIDVISGIAEAKRKVHATLADYDCACLLDKISGCSDGTAGTPMFIASSLCKEPCIGSKNSTFSDAFCNIYGHGELPEKIFQHHGGDFEKRRSDEVRDFYKVASGLQKDISMKLKSTCSDLPALPVVHAPIHDAESIFWIMVFFFLRACPKGYDHDDLSERARRKARTRIFEKIISNEVGCRSTRIAPDEDVLLPEFHRFIGMLERLKVYFQQAWHCLPSEDARHHQFHGHNALQYILLNEIRALEHEKVDILLDETLLGINSENRGVLPSNPFFATKPGKRSGDDLTGNNSGSRKRQKCGSQDNTRDQDTTPIDYSTPAGRIRGILKSSKQQNDWYLGSVRSTVRRWYY